jgi:hypothetical protein
VGVGSEATSVVVKECAFTTAFNNAAATAESFEAVFFAEFRSVVAQTMSRSTDNPGCLRTIGPL